MTEWVRIALVGITGLVSPVDGDSIRMADEAIVRLEGFNTPEKRSSCPTPEGRARERARAAKAESRLTQLLQAKDATLIISSDECGHGRRCGKLMSNGEDAGQTLIAEGLAEPMVCHNGACPPPKDWCSE